MRPILHMDTDDGYITHIKPSILFVGHRQTMQNVASDQGLHYLLTECSIKI